MSKKNPYKRKIPKDMVACGGVLRLYPDSAQVQQLFQNFGNYRFVFNRYKATFDERYENNPDLKVPDKYALEKLLPCLKQEFEFLKLTDSTALQITVDTWQQAQMDFITRKTKNQGKPKFKSKNYYRQSYSIKSNKKKHKDGTVTMTIGIVDDTHVSLPKIGLIKTSNTASFRNYRILRATISWRQDLNRFYISFNGLKPRPKQRKKTFKAVGIDLGLGNEWVVTSNGERWSVPPTKEVERKQAQWQSVTDKRLNAVKQHVIEYNKLHGEHATDKYSSKNWQKSRKTKSKYAIKMHNIRLNRVCKIVKYLIDHYDIIVIEDLNVKNLMKNHKLAKAIANASWYLFRQVLTYECQWYGKKLIVVPPEYTSRTCSACGQRNRNFTGMKTNEWLAVREWTCPFCHAHHNRDINAAKNILYKGIRQAD